MARIETYTAQRNLVPGSTPGIELINPVAQETQKIGNTMSQFAGVLQQRAEQRENFKVENDYRKMQLDLQAQMEEQAASMPPDGSGFHDKFVAETFRPRRDQFLAGVPERLKPKFQALLDDASGADATEWSIKAASTERDQNYAWQRDEIKLTTDQTAVAISMDPEAYDNYLEQGRGLINNSSLPTPEKDKLLRDWENTAQISMLNQLLEKNPSGVLRELGYDPRRLSPTTQFAMLSKAVQWQESSDNPNAVSGKGAVGLMQVMPTTAAEIAAKMGDTNFPAGDGKENRDAVNEYLSNPAVNKQYGEFYLREQLRAFAGANDPIEAALVAYNAGPSVAQKWVESGYDDKILPKETRDYKDSIMSSLKSQPVKGDPSSVKFIGLGEGVNPDLQSRVADAFSTLGLTKVKVNSGFRDPVKNKAVGGADKSQHLDGNAMDIDVSGMKNADKVELLKALSAAGVTGLGIYGNAIHADLGGRRAWGPTHHADSIPAWAAPTIAQHLNGTTPPARAVDQRYASLPYNTRQQFQAKADQLVTAQAAAEVKFSAVEKQNMQHDMDRELALVRSNGQGSGAFDSTNIATILGEEDYVSFERKRETAQRTYTAVSGISTMSTDEMEQRFADYTPDETSSMFVEQQTVQAAVQKEINRVTALRANHPDQAALEFPEVQGVAQKVQEEAANGGVTPATMQSFVASMREAQLGAGILPEAVAPVPRDMALQIGRNFTSAPEDVRRANMKLKPGDAKFKLRDEMVERINLLRQTYGEYTDEVLTYALAEYTNMDKVTAGVLTTLTDQLVNSKGPFKPDAVMADAVEQQNVKDFGPKNIFGETPFLDYWFPPSSTAATPDTLSPEEQRRKAAAETN